MCFIRRRDSSATIYYYDDYNKKVFNVYMPYLESLSLRYSISNRSSIAMIRWRVRQMKYSLLVTDHLSLQR